MRSCLYTRPKHRRNKSFITIIGPLFLSIYRHTETANATTNHQANQSQSSSSPVTSEQHPSSIARAHFSHSHASQQLHSQSRPSRETQERETVIHYAPAMKRRRHEAHNTSLQAAPPLTTSVTTAGNTESSYGGYRNTHVFCKAGPYGDSDVSVQGLSAPDANLNANYSSPWIEDSHHALAHLEQGIVVAQSQDQKRTYTDASKPCDLTNRQQRTLVTACMPSHPQAVFSNSRQNITQQCSQHLNVETPSKADAEKPRTEQVCPVKLLKQCSGSNGVKKWSIDLCCLNPSISSTKEAKQRSGEPLRIDKASTDSDNVIPLCEMVTRALQLDREPSLGARANKTEVSDVCRRVEAFRTVQMRWASRCPTLVLEHEGRLLQVERIFAQLMITFGKINPYKKRPDSEVNNEAISNDSASQGQAVADCSSVALLCTLIRLKEPEFFTAVMSDPDLLWRLHRQLMYQEPRDEWLESWRENQVHTIFACALIVAVQRAHSRNFGWLQRARRVLRGESDQLTLEVVDRHILRHIIAVVKEILQNV